MDAPALSLRGEQEASAGKLASSLASHPQRETPLTLLSLSSKHSPQSSPRRCTLERLTSHPPQH
jgi:hypothetical protein